MGKPEIIIINTSYAVWINVMAIEAGKVKNLGSVNVNLQHPDDKIVVMRKNPTTGYEGLLMEIGNLRA